MSKKKNERSLFFFFSKDRNFLNKAVQSRKAKNGAFKEFLRFYLEILAGKCQPCFFVCEPGTSSPAPYLPYFLIGLPPLQTAHPHRRGRGRCPPVPFSSRLACPSQWSLRKCFIPGYWLHMCPVTQFLFASSETVLALHKNSVPLFCRSTWWWISCKAVSFMYIWGERGNQSIATVCYAFIHQKVAFFVIFVFFLFVPFATSQIFFGFLLLLLFLWIVSRSLGACWCEHGNSSCDALTLIQGAPS